MTIPDFETLVIERLVINLGEIDGINFVSENPPTLSAGISDVPYAFPLVGAMLNSVPSQQYGAGRIIVTRSYPIKILGKSGDADKDGARNEGSIGYKQLRLLMSPLRDYFMRHPRLETEGGNRIDPLRYMNEDLSYQEGGIEYDSAEGRYVLRFNLTITMFAVNTTTA